MAEEFIPLSDLSKSPFRKRDENESSSVATIDKPNERDELEQIDLSIGGMTCSSCVARVKVHSISSLELVQQSILRRRVLISSFLREQKLKR